MMFRKVRSITGHIDDDLLHPDQDSKSASTEAISAGQYLSSQAITRKIASQLVISSMVSDSDRRPEPSSFDVRLTSSGCNPAEKDSELETLYSESSPTEQSTAYMRPSGSSVDRAPVCSSNSDISPSSTNSSLPNLSPPFPDSSSPVLSDSSSNNPSSSPPRTPLMELYPLPVPIAMPAGQYTKHYFGQRPETPPCVRSLATSEDSASCKSSTRPSQDLACIEDTTSRTAPITPDTFDILAENYISPGSNQTKFTRTLHELLLGVISDRNRAYFTDPDVDDAESPSAAPSSACRFSVDSTGSGLSTKTFSSNHDDLESSEYNASDGSNFVTGNLVLNSSRIIGNPLQDQRIPSVQSDTDADSFFSASLRFSNGQHDYEVYDDFGTYDTSDDPENYGGHSPWDLEDSCQDFDDIEDESDGDGEDDEDEELEDLESNDGNDEEDELDQTPTPPHWFLPRVQNLRSMTVDTHSDIDSNNSNIDSPLQRTLSSDCDSNKSSDVNVNSRIFITSRDANAYGPCPPLEMTYPMSLASFSSINNKSSSHHNITRSTSKRRHSDSPSDDSHDLSSLSSSALESRPLVKKYRLVEPSGYNRQSNNRGRFATRPASLRKALSLRSQADLDSDEDNEASTTAAVLCFPTLTPRGDLAPTVPTTPAYMQCSPLRYPPMSQSHIDLLPVSGPVPVIAPPYSHNISQLPLSPEAQAKIRLLRFLERESSIRTRDKLQLEDLDLFENDASVQRKSESGHTDSHNRSILREIWNVILGGDWHSRRTAVKWLLEVLPDYDYDLGDQLTTSPETRFHAAYMFIRYLYLVRPGHEERHVAIRGIEDGSVVDSDMHRRIFESQAGEEIMIWDLAVGCLALSVKYHRDCWDPFLPIPNDEFRLLAPHELTYDDLEAAQRELFFAFSYSLGDTPQSIIDELWSALPALHELLDFGGGWNAVRKETWCTLLEAVFEPDILVFPISVLTASALIHAIITTLNLKYEFEIKWYDGAKERRRKEPTRSQYYRNRVARAERQAEGVILDIQDALGIPDLQLKACRDWLSHLAE